MKCSRFVAADETGPLDEDPCCDCGRRYDRHALPRGVPCISFLGFQVTGARCQKCGEGFKAHVDRLKLQDDPAGVFAS